LRGVRCWCAPIVVWYIPVLQAEREGEQTGAVVKNRV